MGFERPIAGEEDEEELFDMDDDVEDTFGFDNGFDAESDDLHNSSNNLGDPSDQAGSADMALAGFPSQNRQESPDPDDQTTPTAASAISTPSVPSTSSTLELARFAAQTVSFR